MKVYIGRYRPFADIVDLSPLMLAKVNAISGLVFISMYHVGHIRQTGVETRQYHSIVFSEPSVQILNLFLSFLTSTFVFSFSVYAGTLARVAREHFDKRREGIVICLLYTI